MYPGCKDYNRLTEPLRVPTATEEDVWAYLYGQWDYIMNSGNNINIMQPEEFFRGAEDMEQFRQAVIWWPKSREVPVVKRVACLDSLCYLYYNLECPIGTTFIARLTHKANDTALWLQSQGKSTSNPNETKEERKRRQGREAQARFQAKRKEQSSNPELEAAKNELNRLIEVKRITMKEADESVKKAYDHFLLICSNRKETGAYWENEIKKAQNYYQEKKG